LEDLLGVRAIAQLLSKNFTLSEEAFAASAIFSATQDRLLESLTASVSERELIAKNSGLDIPLAAQLDTFDEVATWFTSNPIREFVRFSQTDFPDM
jgi:phosphosulfolactate phosphohydrolase-like enzyme